MVAWTPRSHHSTDIELNDLSGSPSRKLLNFVAKRSPLAIGMARVCCHLGHGINVLRAAGLSRSWAIEFFKVHATGIAREVPN